MVRVPEEEEAVSYRRIPEPDSEVMAVADGVMVHLREEGWISFGCTCKRGGGGEAVLRLTKHSYRAGLWEAKSFTNHYWALEKAKRIVCVNDGAIWIWTMVFVCFSRRIEILDWWHMLQYVWQIANQAMGPASAEASAWVNAQKAALVRSQLRLFFMHILRLTPSPMMLRLKSNRPSPICGKIGKVCITLPIERQASLSAAVPSNPQPKLLSNSVWLACAGPETVLRPCWLSALAYSATVGMKSPSDHLHPQSGPHPVGVQSSFRVRVGRHKDCPYRGHGGRLRGTRWVGDRRHRQDAGDAAPTWHGVGGRCGGNPPAQGRAEGPTAQNCSGQ